MSIFDALAEQMPFYASEHLGKRRKKKLIWWGILSLTVLPVVDFERQIEVGIGGEVPC